MRVKDVLQDLGVRPSKERGQNFLIDDEAINSIVSYAAPAKADKIVEIGPGLGAMTRVLSSFPDLTVIEIEEKFCERLSQTYPDIKVVCDDVRFVDLSALGNDLVIFGNLPYSFSTDIVFLLVKHARSIKKAVIMLQKEFAERLASDPGGRSYGVLSVHAQLYADIKLGPTIPGNAFHPPTQIKSRLVEMTFLPECRFALRDEEWFKKVVKASFFRRRKKLSNSLKASGLFTPEEINQALDASSIDPGRRAETLSIEEFVTLSDSFHQAKC